MVEADAAETNGGFVFASGVGDDDDRMDAIENGSGPGGVLAAEADVDAAGEVSGTKFLGIASVENLRAFGLQGEHGVQRERFQFALQRFVECGAFFAVQDGIVDEIGRGFGLVGGDEVDEGLLGHWLEGVIHAALLADGGDRFLADGLAAEGAGAVSGIDEAGVGQWKQFGLQ